jgi:hypothetical protein
MLQREVEATSLVKDFAAILIKEECINRRRRERQELPSNLIFVHSNND